MKMCSDSVVQISPLSWRSVVKSIHGLYMLCLAVLLKCLVRLLTNRGISVELNCLIERYMYLCVFTGNRCSPRRIGWMWKREKIIKRTQLQCFYYSLGLRENCKGVRIACSISHHKESISQHMGSVSKNIESIYQIRDKTANGKLEHVFKKCQNRVA